MKISLKNLHFLTPLFKKTYGNPMREAFIMSSVFNEGFFMMQQLQSEKLLIPEIRELLREQNYSLLKVALKECNPIGLAGAWHDFTEEEQLQIFKVLSAKAALSLFEVLDIEDQSKLLEKLSDENVSPILNNMASPDVAKIFNKLPSRAVKKMRNLIQRQKALSHVDLLMAFP